MKQFLNYLFSSKKQGQLKHVFNGLLISWVDLDYKKNQFTPQIWQISFSVHFIDFTLECSASISTEDIERNMIPPKLERLKELFINGIGQSYIPVYQDDIDDICIAKREKRHKYQY